MRRADKEDRRQYHGRDRGDHIGFEQVGGHAGAIADVVTDIVGDRGGVTGIIFGDVFFDFADEVGTHVVTYWNGSVQPLTLLSTGLAGHDELQEGFAVLAEHLVGGLTAARLRTLAGRVIAAETILEGAEFIDTYRTLTEDHGFLHKTSFQISSRVHRGGGLVKDAVYLRGLQKVVAYLADGGRIDTLLVGKISVEHTAVIEELQRRGVLRIPPLRPAYLDDPDTFYRLENLKESPELYTLAEQI